MAALREIFASFKTKVDTKGIEKGQKAVSGLSSGMKKLGVLAAGVFAAGALVRGFQELAQTADNLAKQSKTLGLSVESLDAWQTAAGLAGVEAAALSTGFRKLQLGSKQAADGSATMVRAFSQLGIGLDELASSSPEEQFLKVGAALAKIEEPALRNASAQELLGRQGADLIRIFEGGEEATEALLTKLEASAPITTEQAKKFEQMNDQILLAERAFMKFKAALATTIIPIVLWSASKLEILGGALSSIAANTNLFASALGVLAAVLVAKYTPALIRAIAANFAFLAPLALLVLVVDDLVAAWLGGESLIGDAIDSIFGEGTTADIVKFLKFLTEEPGKAFNQFLSDIEFISDQIVAAFYSLFDSIFGEGTTKGYYDFLARLTSEPAAVFNQFFSDLQFIGSQILDWATEFAANLVAPILAAVNKIKGLVSAGADSVTSFFDSIPGSSFFSSSDPEVSSPVTNNAGGLNSNTTINVSATGGAAEIGSAVGNAVGGRNQELSAAFAGLVSRA